MRRASRCVAAAFAADDFADAAQAAAAAVKNKNNDVASLWINAGLLVGVAPVAEITGEPIFYCLDYCR